MPDRPVLDDRLDDRRDDREADENGLPGWMRAALRAPVATDPAARSRVMERVRAAAAAGRPSRTSRTSRTSGGRGGGRDLARPAWASRRGLAPLAGLAAAAGFAGMVTLGALRAPLGGFGALGSPAAGAAAVLHDTLPAGLTGDSVASALLRDTVRLVRFVLVAPTAARLALVGDFNAWDRDATPMMRAVAESTGTWTATLALAPGAYEYAYVVDDTGWTVDPGAPRAVEPSGPSGEGPARSVLVVPEVGR